MKPALAFFLLISTAFGVEYPIVYPRAPIPENRQVKLPQAGMPVSLEDCSQLCYLPANSTTPEVLVDPPAGKGVLQCSVSLDAKRVYYVLNDTAKSVAQFGWFGESEIWVFDLATKQSTKIHAKPNVIYLGPRELPGGKLAYTSDENKRGQDQLWISDADGSHAFLVGNNNLESLLDPELDPIPETRQVNLLVSTQEGQWTRSGLMWGIWTIKPDYSKWEPVFSAFIGGTSYHFHCTARDSEGKLWRYAVLYYHVNNGGLGTLYGTPRLDRGDLVFNHVVDWWQTGLSYFVPKGRIHATPWVNHLDSASPTIDLTTPNSLTAPRVGKVTHPSATPAGDLLLTYSPGPCNGLSRPTHLPFIRSGIYTAPVGQVIARPIEENGIASPVGLTKVIDDPEWCEFGARAVSTFEELYGFDPLPYDYDSHEAPSLPEGTPFGILGGGWINKQQARPLVGNPPNITERTSGINHSQIAETNQGAAVPHTDDEVEWMEFYLQELPTTDEASADNLGERYRSLGMIPTRNPDGSPVTRWAVELPANQSIGMATLDKNKRMLSWSATWKKVSPGKSFTQGCVGCHVHTEDMVAPLMLSIQQPLPTPTRLNGTQGLKIPEWYADVKPIWDAKCAICHETETPLETSPRIPLSATMLNAKLGDIGPRSTRTTLVSWMMPHQARESKLYQRLTTEDVTQKMPKVGSLTPEEIDTFGRWIDLGMPRGKAGSTLADTTKPTLSIKAGKIGAWDLGGIKSVTATLDGNPLDLDTPTDHVWSFSGVGEISVTVTDSAGNVTTETKTVGGTPEPPPSGWKPANLGPPFNGDETLRVKNGVIEKRQKP